MPDFEMTEPRLDCPTSGPLLRALVHAFRLTQGEADASEHKLVGSGEAERSERRYFQGENPTSDDVRDRAAARVASALIEVGFLPDAALPPDSGHPAIRAALVVAVTNWAKTWDEVYRQCSVGWPFLPLSLGGFVLGREVVMDLALRVAAVIHLTDATFTTLMIHAAHDDAGRAILQDAMSRGNRQCDYEHVAAAAAVEQRTAQRWLNESAVPEDHNLRQLSHTLGGKNAEAERAILRYLRVQFGLLRIAQHLESVIGHRWAWELVRGFERLLHIAVNTNREIRANPKRFDSSEEGMTLAQVELLTMGSTSVVTSAVFALWLTAEQPAIWGYELHLAASLGLDRRLEKCWKTIGNWPQFWTNSLEANSVLGLSAQDYQTRCESVALVSLCPPLRESIEAQPPRHPDIGISRALEQKIHRALALLQEDRPEESLKLWDEITKEAPNNPDYLAYYGAALRDAGKRSEAMDMLRRAIDLAPDAVRGHIELARTYLRQGLADSALHHLQCLAPTVRDFSAEILWIMAELLYKTERFADANAAVQRAIELDPENADAHDLAARVLVRMPQTRDSRELAARHAKKAAAGGRRGGLADWLATKRHRRG